MSVLALADAKTHLNITGATSDAELQTFIDAAESAIARRIGPLESTSTTARLRGQRAALVVPKLPAGALVSLTPGNGTALDVELLELKPSGVLQYADLVGSFPAAVYVVEYEVGWGVLEAVDPDAEELTYTWDGPADILLAVKEMVRHLWATQRAGSEGGTRRPGSQGAPGLANTLPGAAYTLPIRVSQLIEPYVPLGV